MYPQQLGKEAGEIAAKEIASRLGKELGLPDLLQISLARQVPGRLAQESGQNWGCSFRGLPGMAEGTTNSFIIHVDVDV